MEIGERTVLIISSIKEAQAAVRVPAKSLVGSEWLLEDLVGLGVIDNIQATLTFPEARKVAGNGSCNRFFGPAEILSRLSRLFFSL